MLTQNPFEKLAQISALVGSKTPEWTQGAGGNFSYKEKGVLYIKASGFRLDQITEQEGIASADLKLLEVNVTKVKNEEDYSQMIKSATFKNNKNLRASMEAGMHSVLGSAWVLHFHPISSVLMADFYFKDNKNFSNFLGQVEARLNIKLSFIDHVRPGLELTRAVSSQNDSKILLIRNHGIILQGPDPHILINTWKEIERDFFSAFFPERAQLNLEVQQSSLLKNSFPIYFPDSAVFLAEINSRLGIKDKKLNWISGSDGIDKNYWELWSSTCMIFNFLPECGEFPEDLASTLSQLPTEIYRKEKSKL